MQIYAVQLDIAWEKPEANRRRIEELLAAQSPEPGGLILLPEMAATGFSPDLEAIAEAVDGPTAQLYGKLAGQYQALVIGGVVNRTEGDAKPGRNLALCCFPDGSMEIYQKMHSFCIGFEHRDYYPGDEVVVLDYGNTKIAPFICYDLRFPEIFRHATLAGAAVLVVIANWPEARDAHWQALLKARAIENQAWVIGLNRTGSDPHISYCGNSQVISPNGEVVARLEDTEGVLQAELDLAAVATRRRAFPALGDVHRKLLGLDRLGLS